MHRLRGQAKVYQPSDRFTFIDKEWRRLGEDVLRIHDQSRLADKDSSWVRSNQQELAPQTRCYLIANGA
jgi:hypothetical protein